MPAKTRIAAEREITETANRSAEARRAANRRSLKLSVVGKHFSPHAKARILNRIGGRRFRLASRCWTRAGENQSSIVVIRTFRRRNRRGLRTNASNPSCVLDKMQ